MYNVNGIADAWIPINALVGVFIDDCKPNLSQTPANLDFREPKSAISAPSRRASTAVLHRRRYDSRAIIRRSSPPAPRTCTWHDGLLRMEQQRRQPKTSR